MRVFYKFSAATLVFLLMGGGAAAYAQAYAPLVNFNVTLPDGSTKDLQATESGLVTVSINGHEYGVRPTMMDDQGNRIVMTIFDMGDKTIAVHELGEIEVKAGGPVVA